MANDRQCEYGPTEIRAIWENTCDLLKQNLQCEADVFPLRAKTPQYTESVYKWAENNKKIVDTIKARPGIYPRSQCLNHNRFFFSS